MKKISRWLLPISLLLFFGAVFLFRLGWGSLQSYDEAWYGSIARDVLRFPNPLVLHFNGRSFTDHPPGLFWLMASLYSIFGISEWSTRLLSALTGAGSLAVLYLIGQRLGSRLAGLSAALMLGSSLWFVFRARSGNLDVPFLFFFLLTIYLALLTARRGRLLPLLAMSFGWLLISKTIIGLAALVPIGVILLPKLVTGKFKLRQILWSAATLFIVVIPWYAFNAYKDGAFLQHNLFEIGTRGGSLSQLQLTTQLLYLRSGVGKWFMLFFASLPLLPFVLKRYGKTWLVLIAWLLAVGLPFMLNPRTEIWHLLPIYPPLMLMTSFSLIGFSHWLTHKMMLVLPQQKKLIKHWRYAVPLLTTCLVAVIAAWQLKAVLSLTIPKQNTVSWEADISLRSKTYPGTLHLKEVVGPTVIFYADRQLNSFGHARDSYRSMVELLTTSPQSELIIVKTNELPQLTLDKIPYRLLEQNTEYALIGNLPIEVKEATTE